MPKVTIEFNLPDEEGDLVLARSGPALFSVISDFDQDLRRIVKHGDPLLATAGEMREKLQEYLDSHDIHDLYSLVE